MPITTRPLTGLIVALALTAAVQAGHDKTFWHDLAQKGYQPSDPGSVPALSEELDRMLGSPDPELRDEIAYSTLAVWIYQKRLIDSDHLRILTSHWLENLTRGIGESETDTVYRRSFSALVLSVVVARDNADPFLTTDELRHVENAALDYLKAERDLRGYDPVHGWVHATAHTADLLKFVGRSRLLDAEGPARILDAVSTKLASVPVVFTHGEDERLARAVLSIVNRADFNQAEFSAWTSRVRPAAARHPTEAQLVSAQNLKNFLSKLEVLLSLAPQPSAPVQAARDAVRVALKDLY